MVIEDNKIIRVRNEDIVNGTYIIPNNITNIGSGAFSNCTILQNVTIPDSVKSIGYSAFSNCKSLQRVSIPNGIEDIKVFTFDGCTSLQSVTIPTSVTSIGKYAFSSCDSLQNITIPNSVRDIGYGAFYNCGSLQSVSIPNSVTSIGYSAFEYCPQLKKEDKKYYFKAFNVNLTCRGFQYEENKWFECNEAILCARGFHACKNAFDLFNYYHGKINKDVIFYLVELEDISQERGGDSKVCAKKIRLIKRINSYQELLN